MLNNLNEMPEFPLDMKLFYNFNSSKRKKRFNTVWSKEKKRNKLKNFFLLIPITAFMEIFSLLAKVTHRRVGKIIVALSEPVAIKSLVF